MKRILTFTVLIALILTVNSANFANVAENNESLDKIICQATLDDGFSDDCVIVSIDKQHGGINKFFSKEKFKVVDLSEVYDWTYIGAVSYTHLWVIVTIGNLQKIEMC